jgi:hypothetical protein
MVVCCISPNYTWEKLENPNLDDLLDVFEDRQRNWLLKPAESLLQMQDYVPTISLLFTYFESIQVYISGKDSKNASKKFFVDGFLVVFGSPNMDKSQLKKVAKTIYTEGRCGFFHNGLSGRKILYSPTRNEALTITLPKKDGKIDLNKEIESIVINPARFHWCVKRHFDKYISDLRKNENKTLRENFKKAVDVKWDMGGKDLIIGMTEKEFQKNE